MGLLITCSHFYQEEQALVIASKDAIRHTERFLDYYRDKMMLTFSLLYR